MKVVHITTGLGTGGSEVMLYKLLSAQNRDKIDSTVISLIDRGTLGSNIAALGIPVYTLGMKRGQATLGAVLRLAKIMRSLKPDLIQSWMYHANLATLIATAFLGVKIPVIWNIRGSHTILKNEKPLTAATIWLGGKLSHFPTKIINNSHTSAIAHQTLGYPLSKTIVIPNGFDTDKFLPSQHDYKSLRLELDVPDNTILIGLIARYHRMKDHANFCRSMQLLVKKYSHIKFVLVGKEVDWENQKLATTIRDFEIIEYVHLLGERKDIPYITAALDIASSSSYGEGFPNVIGEAMSCGVPCAVTDVGDSAWIVGNTGRVVPPNNPEALANAWQELIEMGAEGRFKLGSAARSRIIECFSLDSVVTQYETLYETIFAEKTKIKAKT